MSIVLAASKGLTPLVAQVAPFRTLLHGGPEGLGVGQIAMISKRKTPFGATFVDLIVVK